MHALVWMSVVARFAIAALLLLAYRRSREWPLAVLLVLALALATSGAGDLGRTGTSGYVASQHDLFHVFLDLGVTVIIALVAYSLTHYAGERDAALESLRAANRDLVESKRSLERRVTQRTIELESANAALGDSEQRHRLLAERSTDLITLHEMDGRFAYVSPAARALLAYEPGELVGRSPYDFFHPDDVAAIRANHEALLAGVAPPPIEYRIRRADGRYAWFETRTQSIRDERDGRVRQIVCVSRDTSARRAAEDANRLAQAALDAMSSQVVVIDDSGTILAANRAWLDFASANGATPESAGPGAHYLPVARDERAVHHGAPTTFADQLREVLSGARQHVEVEYSCLAAGGSRWFVARATRFAGGGPSRIVVQHEDITTRVLARQALQQSADEVHDLYNHAPCGYHSLNADGVFVRMNDTELAWLGYTREEVVGRRHFTDVLTPECRPLFAQRFADLKERGYATNLDYEFLRKDGTTFPVLLNATLLRDAHGHFVMTRGIVFDMTERRRVESQVRESNDLLRAVIEGCGDAAFLKDREGRYILINRAVTEFIGGSPEAVIGHTDAELFPPADAAAIRETDLRIMESGAAVRLEELVQTARGERTFMANKSPLRDARGNVIGVIGFSRDITEYKRSQERLQRAERLVSIGTLAAGIAHEINNPVGGILMGAQSALADLDDPSQRDFVRRCLNEIVDDARRCGRIVKSVLRFARQEPTEKWPTDLSALLRRSIDMLRDLTEQRRITFRIDVAPDLPQVPVNPTEIEQVFVNLLRNAIQASSPGGTVDIAMHRIDDRVRMRIRDFGHGMSADTLERAFDPFYTTRQFEGGSGLGLSVVHGIVKAHGGNTVVQSSAGEGAEFTVDLPV
ncbi:MAG: PAS domain S-box protein [Phycisphaerae bacterium]